MIKSVNRSEYYYFGYFLLIEKALIKPAIKQAFLYISGLYKISQNDGCPLNDQSGNFIKMQFA